MAAKAKEPKKTTFISSGSTRLDDILGGGWAQGRMVTLAGESQSGKSLMMVIVAANFKKEHPNGLIWICDAEAAFDPDYAESLGLYPEDYELIDAVTIEEFADKVAGILGSIPADVPGAIFLDSLDTLFTETQKDTDVSKEKGFEDSRRAQTIGKFIKKSVAMLKSKNVLFFVIQQIRDAVTYTGKVTSGGNAPGFWSSQRVWLKSITPLDRQINGQTITYGVQVKATTKKCRFAPHNQEAIFDIVFGKGIDDVKSCLMWLRQVKKLELLPTDITSVEQVDKRTKAITYKLLEKDSQIIDRIFKLDPELRKSTVQLVKALTRKIWTEMRETSDKKNKVLGFDDEAPLIDEESDE